MLDGANKIEDLAKNLKAQGVKSVAMTDHGNMFGAIDFYTTMKKYGIKPIIGIEAYIHNEDDLGDKSTRQRFHLCLFAKNEVGYKNLMYLSSQSFVNGFYYYPRLNKKLLREHSEGLICSSACLQGEVSWHLNLSERNIQYGAKGYEAAKAAALEYKDIFGDDFYLELMRHGIEDQRKIDQETIKLSLETGIKIIATNDTHYPFKEWAEAQEVYMCIAMNKEFDDPDRLRHSVHEFYLKTKEEMAKNYADIPEAIENTQEIANKCDLNLDLGHPTPPNFKFTLEYAKEANLNLPEPDKIYSLENDKVYFEYVCKKGLEKRLEHIDANSHEEYKKRLEYEINIINNMKFPGYMLIVWDFIAEAKKRDIPVGPGRGSAAGSLVAYSMQITDLDPMPYQLLFERFLNPERVSMPDIDVDFCQSRRGEIIEYVAQKYGRFNVAQVITFGKLLAKGVIRDVARVMGMPYQEADKMAKLIPDELGITLNGKGKEGEDGYKPGAFQKEEKLRELIETDKKAAQVWDFSLRLEGLYRNAGTHAAGVVISNEELWHKTPLYKVSRDDTIVTQYEGKWLEDVDLIKFDFLGLKTLTVIDGAVKLIKNRFNKDVNWAQIGLEDKKVYKTIQSGHTLGLFQIESSGMQQLAAKLKPSGFEDVIAMLALYRPGPMESGMLDDFVERKHGRADISYMMPELEPILKPTYGVIVYQEQVMQIVQSIGGFSLGKADMIRRAMGKKKKEIMDEAKKEFVDGAVKNGFDEHKCSELFDLIIKFAGYGFNKSHSAAYAMITYQTAWLKTYYPQEFMASLLTSEQDKTDKVVKYIDELKHLGIKLLPPCVSRSVDEFKGGKGEDGEDAILYGLGAIKGAGHIAIKSIMDARDEKPFADLADFISRIDPFKVNKKVIDALIKSGSMDCFGFSRRALLEQIDLILEAAQKATQAKKLAENSLFGDDEELTTIKIDLINSKEFTQKDLLAYEKESLGLYVSGHPLDDFKDKIERLDYTLSSELEHCADESMALIVGKVEEISTKISKKGNKFAIVYLMDFHGSVEITAFSNFISELESIDKQKPLALKVSVQKNDQQTRLTLRKIIPLEDAQKEKVKTKKVEKMPSLGEPLHVSIPFELTDEQLMSFYDSCLACSGNRPLVLELNSDKHSIILETSLNVRDDIDEALKKILHVA
ncbi:MAG: DNA polymerase III subunit alpha [Proteobacteria bacterium]|nr:MAG: DNA polymerase III subunit alpha [Pseudomonadota bacterium]